MNELERSWSRERLAREGNGVLAEADRREMMLAMAEATSEAQTYLHSAQGRLGELRGLQFLKTKLNAMSSTENAFAYYASVVDLHRTASLQLKPLRGLLDLTRERALQNFSVFQGGESFELKPPTVHGEGNQAPVRGRARSLFAACFADARVRGRSSLIEFEDAMALDFEDVELASLDDHLEYDPALFWTGPREGWVIDNTRKVPDLELDEAFMLVGTHSWEFGHWFLEYLPKYLSAAQACNLDRIPILLDAGMPEQHQQSIRLLAPPSVEIITLAFGQSARVRRLWCAACPYYSPLWEEMNEKFNWGTQAAYPATFAPLMKEMSRRLEPVSSGGEGGSRRIFLARKPDQHRKLRNSREIEEIARSRGFRIVYPQDLSFGEQVKLIQNCDFVLGPDGSAFFLTFISKPGTKVLILYHTLTLALALVTSIIEARGISVEVLTGPIVNANPRYPHQSDYEIDAAGFVEHLDRWLQKGGVVQEQLGG